MDPAKIKFTVQFEDPFWIGLYERQENGRYEACKIRFGAEPKDYEVYAFLMKNWNRFQFSPAVAAQEKLEKKANPKRMQRKIRRSLQNAGGIGTKAQQALKLQQEQGKQQRKIRSRIAREEKKNRKFVRQKEKRKEKHRGH